MVYCTLEEAWGGNFSNENSCSNYILNNIDEISNISSNNNNNTNIDTSKAIDNNLQYNHYQQEQIQYQQQQIQQPDQQIQYPQQQIQQSEQQIQYQQIQPPDQQIQLPQQQIQPLKQQIQLPQQQQHQQSLQEQIQHPPLLSHQQIHPNNNIFELKNIIELLRKENNELKNKLKNKLNLNIDNLPELFLYGMLILMVIDLFIGLKRRN